MTVAEPTADSYEDPLPDKAERVLEAALQEFAELTFTGARVPDIAKRAGVAYGTVYHYFPSKEVLANAVYRRWKSKTRHYRIEVRRDAEPREAFTGVWNQLVAFAKDHPAAFTFLETHHHAAYLDDESRALAARVDAGGLAFFEHAKRLGVVKDIPAHLLVAMVVGAFVGLTKELDRSGTPFDPALLSAGEAAAWDLIARSSHD